MNMPENFYKEKLYPLQDGALKIVKESGTPFYLSGGTALSRFYLNHRFSDDIDLFLNNDEKYSEYVTVLLNNIERAEILSIDSSRIIKTENYTQIYVINNTEENQTKLKIDIVNDVSSHFGEFCYDKVLGKIDSWQNILSNKLTAIFRYEPKDIVDIWAISKAFSFSWKTIIEQAKIKEAGLDPLTVIEILNSFPINLLDSIKWSTKINADIFAADMAIISNDIFEGKNNSLCIK
jgi:hypothetical protein